MTRYLDTISGAGTKKGFTGQLTLEKENRIRKRISENRKEMCAVTE